MQKHLRSPKTGSFIDIDIEGPDPGDPYHAPLLYIVYPHEKTIVHNVFIEGDVVGLATKHSTEYVQARDYWQQLLHPTMDTTDSTKDCQIAIQIRICYMRYMNNQIAFTVGND